MVGSILYYKNKFDYGYIDNYSNFIKIVNYLIFDIVKNYHKYKL